MESKRPIHFSICGGVLKQNPQCRPAPLKILFPTPACGYVIYFPCIMYIKDLVESGVAAKGIKGNSKGMKLLQSFV